AIPTLIFMSVLGALVAVFLQGQSIANIFQTMTNGFTVDSEVKAVDILLNSGGLMSMLETVTILIIATALGGILEESGAFKTLTNQLMAHVQSTKSLIHT